ncbi:hypothetical protein HDV02_006692 [Globomyces sp. JEL0801]|nr:hypothetical protein HDV02_006692 [Globomyces sp. JEL0801]
MFISVLLTSVLAQNFIQYDTSECAPVYSTKDIAGKQPQITIEIKPVSESGSLAVAVFAFEDRYNFEFSNGFSDLLLCSDEMVKKGQCLESELGAFHLIKNSTTPVLNQNVKWGVQKNTSSSLTEEILPSSIEIPENTNNVNSNSSKLSSDGAIHSRLSNHDEKLKQLSSITHRSIGSVPVDPKLIKIKYNVEVSSLYCIYISSSTQEDVRDFTTNFILTNPYGLLPAIFYPSLPQLLPIQHYVSGVIAFLVVEMAFNYGFFENYNETGEISYLWMPTTNNERYGLDQIATDEEDFYDAPTELQPQDNENMKSRIGKNYQTSEYDEDDTADDDDILAWAEENVVV